MLTQTRLKKVLRYEPKTGEFFWLVTLSSAGQVGTRAGQLSKSTGYWRIDVDGRAYRGHRLAWLYMHGHFPEGQLDHKTRDRSSCRIEDLREATQSQNLMNSKTRPSRSGLKGAHWRSREQTWISSIKRNGKQIHLGYFATAEDAHQAYCEAAKSTFGEFFCSGAIEALE
jgi:hypothetical protein